MNAARQRLRRFGWATGARTRSAAPDCIVRAVSFGPDPLVSDFMFLLTADEMENLRCQKFTSSWGGTRYFPHAFTEQGVYMLMTVLRGDLATRQSKAIVRTFKQMKDYIVQNRGLLGERELLQLSLQTSKNVAQISELKGSLAQVEGKVASVVLRVVDSDDGGGLMALEMVKYTAKE